MRFSIHTAWAGGTAPPAHFYGVSADSHIADPERRPCLLLLQRRLWSKDHESPRHLGFAMLDIGGRHALKERQLDGSGGNLANFEE
jgi:hypothetical protein